MSADNYLEKITHLWAFLSKDEGGEGVIAGDMDIGGHTVHMPFVCADNARMKSLINYAKLIGRESGKTIKLVKFTQREEIEIIWDGNK